MQTHKVKQSTKHEKDKNSKKTNLRRNKVQIMKEITPAQKQTLGKTKY